LAWFRKGARFIGRRRGGNGGCADSWHLGPRGAAGRARHSEAAIPDLERTQNGRRRP
jgi:hypothetical protein